jgi:predicted protein tyrosine phosphatase
MTVSEENPFKSLEASMAFDSRDWSTDKRDAWNYGIICGWDDAWDDIALMHGWTVSAVERLQRLHERYIAARDAAYPPKAAMRFFVYSRQAIEAIRPHVESHVIISITTPEDPDPVKLPVTTATAGVLHLSFDDLDENYLSLPPEHPRLVRPVVMFSPEHARRILDFIRQHGQVEHLIVHCDGGMSRSPAVAAALSRIITGSDQELLDRYHPNSLVYQVLLDEEARCRGQE